MLKILCWKVSQIWGCFLNFPPLTDLVVICRVTVDVCEVKTHLKKTTLHNSLTKDLKLEDYEVQFTPELKPIDHQS